MPLDDSPYEIPQSRGMPLPVRILVGVGLLVIFFMGIISALFSGIFHVWPAKNTTQVQLRGHF